MSQHIIAALRVKNEARWIERVVRAVLPVCETVLVLDDHSTDGTPDLCAALGATVIRSAFGDLNESRDKDFLLTEAYKRVPQAYHGHHSSPYWMLAIDGDEELVAEDQPIVRRIVEDTAAHCYSLKIPYLWDREDQWRVDGVYRRFHRPSLFRLINPVFRYKTTPFGNGCNFHCSSIPQEMLHHVRPSEARLLHYGYLHREDRLRKYEWYNRLDPGNKVEDGYRHMVIGDLFPADSVFRHAGPLELARL